MIRHFFFFIATLLVFDAAAQSAEVINILNPSFESLPILGAPNSKPPRGWRDCGFPNETPPDIHPVPDGQFRVIKGPSHGDTYLGMVVRDNETYEAMSQRLQGTLKAGQCYEIRMKLARSEYYLSLSRVTEQPTNYIEPVTLQIWGGNEYCQRAELLYTTPTVENTYWQPYNFQLRPKEGTYNYIVIQAFYKTPTLFPYNGNVLVDDLSNIVQVNCDGTPMPVEPPTGEDPIVVIDPDPQPPITQLPPGVNITPSSPGPDGKADDEVEETQQPKAPPRLGNKTKEQIKKGETIKIEKIFFDIDKSDLRSNSFESLNELAEFLIFYPDVKIEIGGHTNGRCEESFCNRLSLARAKSVVDYLVEKGVKKDQLTFKGYGKSQLINKLYGGALAVNQRVEIKVLELSM